MTTHWLPITACLALSACGPSAGKTLELTGPATPAHFIPRISALAASLPAAVFAASAVEKGGKVYLAGGLKDTWPGTASTSNCTNTLSVFDPATGELSAAGTLPEPVRGNLLLSVPNGDLLTAMGYCGASTALESDVYALRPGGAARLGAVPVGAFYPAGGVLEDGSGNAVLVAAGGYGSGPERDQIQSFDVATGTARQWTARLPKPRPLAAGAVSGNTLYVLGGSDLGEPPATRATNPLSDEIVAVTLTPESATVVGHLPEPLMGGCAVTQSDGTILLFGGAHYVVDPAGLRLEPVDSIVVFTPETGEVAFSDATLPSPAAGLACAVLPDDRVFLFGGAGATLAPTDTLLQVETSSSLQRIADAQTSSQQAALRLQVGLGCTSAGGLPALGALVLWALRRRRRG